MFDELGKETFISQLTSTLNRRDIFEELISLDFPIWIFYSKNHRLLNKEALERINLLKDKIKIISLESTSHIIPLEYPKELANNIKLWMNTF